MDGGDPRNHPWLMSAFPALRMVDLGAGLFKENIHVAMNTFGNRFYPEVAAEIG